MSYPSADLTFARLQSQVALWSKRNFPDKKPYQPLLGRAEEIGELCHGYLKAEQGIRGTAAEHAAAKIDAVANIIIYLADYCECNGIDLQDAVESTWRANRLTGDASAPVANPAPDAGPLCDDKRTAPQSVATRCRRCGGPMRLKVVFGPATTWEECGACHAGVWTEARVRNGNS